MVPAILTFMAGSLVNPLPLSSEEIAANHPPTAEIREKIVEKKDYFLLSLDAGKSSDPDEEVLTFRWNIDGRRYSGKNIKNLKLSPYQSHSIVLIVSDPFLAEDRGEIIIKQKKPLPEKPAVEKLSLLKLQAAQPSKKIIINELLPDPEGEDSRQEWIELFNSGKEAVKITDWKILKAKDLKKGQLIMEKSPIKPGGIIQIKLDSLTLNNEQDQIFLLDDRGRLIDRLSYENPQKNQSYSRIIKETLVSMADSSVSQESFSWTSQISPGLANPAQKEFQGQVQSLHEQILTIEVMSYQCPQPCNKRRTLHVSLPEMHPDLAAQLFPPGAILNATIELFQKKNRLIDFQIIKTSPVNKPPKYNIFKYSTILSLLSLFIYLKKQKASTMS